MFNMHMYFDKKPGDLWSASRSPEPAANSLSAMAAKYYTHFVTARGPSHQADMSEWSGVVELRRPLESDSGTRELRSLLAESFDLEMDEIRILHWARLH